MDNNERIESISKLIRHDPNLTFKSHYQNRFGQFVPRVTEILSFDGSSTEALMGWANSLGFKHIKYRDARNAAADTGTDGHNAIESFLRGESFDTSNMVVRAFQQWYMSLTTHHKFEVLSMEQSLVCDWFGGTYDLLCKIDDKVFLVDFKTSNHITYKYWMQIAAYIYMLKLQGIVVEGAIILQLSKTTPEYNEFVLDFAYSREDAVYIANCTYAFFALVNAYYAVNGISLQYKQIFQ